MVDDTDWTLIDFSDPRQKEGGASAPSAKPETGVCPKCGKHVGRGMHFHVRACKGVADDEASGPE